MIVLYDITCTGTYNYLNMSYGATVGASAANSN